MHASALFTVALLASGISAAPVRHKPKKAHTPKKAQTTTDPDPPFQITQLSITKTAGANTTIVFTVTDPSEYGNSSAVCTGSWPTGSSGYPQDTYVQCGTSSFGWNMASFQNFKNFQLGLEHSFEDPDLGSPPYDYVNNYAMGNVTADVLACASQDGTALCHQNTSSISAPVYASNA